jgi:hypothetical protein
MARKDVLFYQLAAAQSLGASFHTSPTLVKFLDNCSYQINATTANAVGTFSVQASLDYQIDETTNTVVNPGNWIDLTLAGGVPTLASANDQIIINLNQLPFKAIRLAYTRTSGTGTAAIYLNAKQIGG